MIRCNSINNENESVMNSAVFYFLISSAILAYSVGYFRKTGRVRKSLLIGLTVAYVLVCVVVVVCFLKDI